MLTVPTSILLLRQASDGAKEGGTAFDGAALEVNPTKQPAIIPAATTPIVTPVEKETLGVTTPVGVAVVAREADAVPTD